MTCLPGILCAPRTPWFLNPGLFPEGSAGGISTKSSLSPESSSSDAQQGSAGGKAEVTVENREVPEQKKLTKVHKIVRAPYPYSFLKPTKASGFQKAICGLTAVLPLTAPFYMVPSGEQ